MAPLQQLSVPPALPYVPTALTSSSSSSSLKASDVDVDVDSAKTIVNEDDGDDKKEQEQKNDKPSAEDDKHPTTTATNAVTVALVNDEAPLPPPEEEAPSTAVVLQNQAQRLPLARLLLIYFGIGIALFLSFVDQTSVSTAAPVIGNDLNGSSSISWVGTSFLVANCAMHLVYGRLSDIFGRKLMLQIALFFLGFGNLLCGFAKTPVQLYIFRAISGLGGGGVNGIAMTVVSDIVSLKDRGKYQGLISAACSFGSAIGPFVGGGLASSTNPGQWRWIFWMTSIMSAFVIVGTHFILPLKKVTGSVRAKLRQIDYIGIALSAAGTVLLLVPISGGGSSFAWNSPTVIALLVIGALLMVAFVVAERVNKLPILPLRLFKIPTLSIVLIQSFLVGVIYYGNIFYVPMWFQYVMGYSALRSGEMVLIYTLPQSIYGIVSGQYVSRTNHYKRVVIIGSGLWCLGAGLQCMWSRQSGLGTVLGVLQVNSIGVGFCLQTTLVAMMSVTPDGDRAVVTSSRNFFRTMGGAFGLAISNAIFNNVVKSSLPSDLPASTRQQVLESSLETIDTLPVELRDGVIDAYVQGLRTTFIFFTAVSGLCFILAFFIKEVAFRKDDPSLKKETKKDIIAEKSESSTATNVDLEAGEGEVTPAVERKK